MLNRRSNSYTRVSIWQHLEGGIKLFAPIFLWQFSGPISSCITVYRYWGEIRCCCSQVAREAVCVYQPVCGEHVAASQQPVCVCDTDGNHMTMHVCG